MKKRIPLSARETAELSEGLAKLNTLSLPELRKLETLSERAMSPGKPGFKGHIERAMERFK